ncbi:unnamed protein product [Rhizophagus irregularis]|nr:unnamed protein product [Rhizophagus irregularis]
MDPHRISWIYAEIPRVSSQGIRKILELFRFPHISIVFDVDFHVYFKRKKIPDDYTETSLIPYQHGSSVAHTDFDTYVNSSDFLMLFTYPKTATLGQIMSAVGSTNTTGPIGPKLRLLLGSLGYEVKKELKLSSIPIKNYNPLIHITKIIITIMI